MSSWFRPRWREWGSLVLLQLDKSHDVKGVWPHLSDVLPDKRNWKADIETNIYSLINRKGIQGGHIPVGESLPGGGRLVEAAPQTDYIF